MIEQSTWYVVVRRSWFRPGPDVAAGRAAFAGHDPGHPAWTEGIENRRSFVLAFDLTEADARRLAAQATRLGYAAHASASRPSVVSALLWSAPFFMLLAYATRERNALWMGVAIAYLALSLRFAIWPRHNLRGWRGTLANSWWRAGFIV